MFVRSKSSKPFSPLILIRIHIGGVVGWCGGWLVVWLVVWCGGCGGGLVLVVVVVVVGGGGVWWLLLCWWWWLLLLLLFRWCCCWWFGRYSLFSIDIILTRNILFLFLLKAAGKGSAAASLGKGAAAALEQEAESHATSLEYMSDDELPDGEFPLLLCALCEGGAMFTHTCQDCRTSYVRTLPF